MPIDKHWEQFKAADWETFARSWLAELRGDSAADVGQSVVMMNFTATPAQQWQFILAATKHASEEELPHIAAGPVERLLGSHGDEYIDEVERRAMDDPKFGRMLLSVWRYTMTDELWDRLQAIKAKVADACNGIA